MEEKMKYSTRQQKIILECLQEYGDTFYTIDQFYGAPSWKRDPDRKDNGIQRTGAAAEGGRGAEGSVCGGSACPVSFYT